MTSALDELARAARMSQAASGQKAESRRTARQIEAGRTARERIAMSLDLVVEDLSDERIGSNVAIAMIEAAGVKLDRPLTEALRRDDVELARSLKKFVARTRKAIAQAAREVADELRR